MDNKSKSTIFEKLFANGLGGYLITISFTFLLNRFLNAIWLRYAPIVVVVIYIIFSIVSIYCTKWKPVLNLSKTELLFYQIIIPVAVSVLIGSVSAGIMNYSQMDIINNIMIWFSNNENQLFLVVIFSIVALVCYFIAYEIAKICDNAKLECHVCDESIELHQVKLDGISEKLGNIQAFLEKKSQVGYTATCIPVKYNAEHDTFVFALIRNLSHEESQWMFPGSHVEVSNNQLDETFSLTDISIVPGTVIEDKVKKEAGLVDLQFIDPYYEVVSFENTINGKERRSYPNTCYPAKAPVFNYLFKVSKSAKCYKNLNHRCHYDFTYIGEYSEINDKESEYEVVEIEINRDKVYKSMERTEAVAYISNRLREQINKKIRLKTNKKTKNQFYIPFDQLCLDSIPEMIYNAILFYSDYKKLS